MAMDLEASCSLSVIFCASPREARRLPDVLLDAHQHLQLVASERAGFTFEIIAVVDAADPSPPRGMARVLELRAPGAAEAIRAGALGSKGAVLLFAPADGGVRPSELLRLADLLSPPHAAAAAAAPPPPRVALGLRGKRTAVLPRAVQLLAASLTQVDDPDSNAFAMSRAAARMLLLERPASSLDELLALLLRRGGYLSQVAGTALVLRARRLRIPITTAKLAWVQMEPSSNSLLSALVALCQLLLLWVRTRVGLPMGM
ncbi:hypothetical protein AB1Y20_013580 [Prymnesium parvum]|uniref:Ceramide glucosyltransferase n=1 Tax=Prymnesium parvum TaxID=97485 RepID=A0AB34IG86_PRYPA